MNGRIKRFWDVNPRAIFLLSNELCPTILLISRFSRVCGDSWNHSIRRCDFSLRMTKKQKSEKSRKNLTNAEKLRVSEITMI